MSLRGGKRTRGIAREDPRIVGLGDAGGTVVTPDPVEITFNIDDPTVIQTGSISLTPDAVEITLLVDDPTVIEGGPITVTPLTVDITLAVLDPVVIVTGTRRGGLIPALHATP